MSRAIAALSLILGAVSLASCSGGDPLNEACVITSEGNKLCGDDASSWCSAFASGSTDPQTLDACRHVSGDDASSSEAVADLPTPSLKDPQVTTVSDPEPVADYGYELDSYLGEFRGHPDYEIGVDYIDFADPDAGATSWAGGAALYSITLSDESDFTKKEKTDIKAAAIKWLEAKRQLVEVELDVS
ncbi:MAG: hypothetical protein Q7T73_22550 [Beijerinckiaceae bacterium]|nr:hypothetical protein [Beijerinckiaceae bacterium]